MEGSTAEPDFLSGVKNMTVPEGRDVTLSCSVKNLGSHKVRPFRFYSDSNKVSYVHYCKIC